MRILFKQSNSLVTKFYIAGLAQEHPCFAPIPKKEAKRLSRFIDGKINLPTHYSYSKCIRVKRRVIAGDSPKKIRAQLDLINFRDLPDREGKKKVRKLSVLWKKNSSIIHEYLKSIHASQKGTFTVVLVRGIGETSESLGDILVLGSDTKTDTAFAVFLEELLHTVVKVPKKLQDAGLKEEAYIGMHLYRILERIKYPRYIINSVVFGWQNGRRIKLTKSFLKSFK